MPDGLPPRARSAWSTRARAASASPPRFGAPSTRATRAKPRSCKTARSIACVARRARRRPTCRCRSCSTTAPPSGWCWSLPDGLRHRELQERAALYAALADDGVAPPAYVLEPQVVFGAAGLRALLAPPPTEAAFDATSEPARGRGRGAHRRGAAWRRRRGQARGQAAAGAVAVADATTRRRCRSRRGRRRASTAACPSRCRRRRRARTSRCPIRARR